MPNWCENRVYIEATSEDIGAIVAAIGSDDDTKGLLAYLRPEPAYGEKDDPDMPSWYLWRIANWGTKWDVNAEIISQGDGWINLAFESAWSPPTDALAHWQEQSPETRTYNIRFIERGMAFCGQADPLGEEVYTIPTISSSVKELIPAEIDEEFAICEEVARWEREEEEA